MTPSWIREGGAHEGLARRALLSPLTALAWLYGGGARLHRRLYESGLRTSRSVPCSVVSVGSPTVGGSAKTPFAAWLAQGLSRRGHRVALASRGYGRDARKGVQIVSDGHRLRGSLADSGDEPLWLAARAQPVPVLVGSDRGVVGLRAVAQFGTEILVLDDGFQHRRVARDLDLVSLDGRFGVGNAHVLPRGPLRESLDALRHADGVIVIDPPLQELARAAIEQWAPDARIFGARRRTPRLWLLGGRSQGAPAAVSLLQGAKVGVLASIARPEAFRTSLEGLGAEVVAVRTFRDHHHYRASDLRDLANQAPTWVTTEKDAMKLRASWAGPVDVWVVALDLEVDDADSLLAWVENQLSLPA